MTTLPTGWLRDVPCASVRLDHHDRIAVTLPAGLVPTRRDVEMRTFQGPPGCLVLELIHGDVFKQSRPGYNAWQTTHEGYYPGRPGPIKVRQVERKLDRLHGSYEDRRRLMEVLKEYSSCDRPDVLIRVTPEGFQLLLHPTPIALRGLGTKGLSSGLRELIRNHPRHGDRASPHSHFHSGLPNCRCAYPDFNQEIHTMRKIDTTTALELPFGLIGGQSIVQCEFSDGGVKDYAYFAGGLVLAEGDYCVVASPHGDGVFDEESGGYLKVVRVVSTTPSPEGVRKAAKWVISKVDVAEYRDRRRVVEEMRTLDAQIEIARKEALQRLELKQLMDLSPELNDLIAKRFELTGISLPTDEPKAD